MSWCVSGSARYLVWVAAAPATASPIAARPPLAVPPLMSSHGGRPTGARAREAASGSLAAAKPPSPILQFTCPPGRGGARRGGARGCSRAFYQPSQRPVVRLGVDSRSVIGADTLEVTDSPRGRPSQARSRELAASPAKNRGGEHRNRSLLALGQAAGGKRSPRLGFPSVARVGGGCHGFAHNPSLA